MRLQTFYGQVFDQQINALIDQSEFDKAEAMLDRLARTRMTRIQASVPRLIANPNLRGPSSYGTVVVGATGGIVTKPTMALIGEAGPEAVVPLNKTPGSSPLPGALGGGSTNITINMPPGSDGDSVVRALRQYARRNGPIQGIT
mgnify:FL=1